MVGEVFTDGSCQKAGPITWHRTGWSVCKVSEQGELLGYMRGVVGSALPQTSPASEHVAGLAAANAPGGQVECALSDYKGLDQLQDRAPWDVYARQQIYAGVKLQILGRAPQGFRIIKVPAHVEVTSGMSQRARYLALGNDHADRNAKVAAEQQVRPTDAQLQDHAQQQKFLKMYYQYIPRALALWPAVGPSVGKKPLPRREAEGGRDRRQGAQRAGFLQDIFSEFPAVPTPSPSPSAATTPSDVQSERRTPMQSGAAAVRNGFGPAAGPAPATTSSSSSTPQPQSATVSASASVGVVEPPCQTQSQPTQPQPAASVSPAGVVDAVVSAAEVVDAAGTARRSDTISYPAADDEASRRTELTSDTIPYSAAADEGDGRTAIVSGASTEFHSRSSCTSTPVSPPAQAPQTSAPPKEAAPDEGHDWVQVNSKWTCRSCLSVSRSLFPPQGHCPGLAPSLADLVRDPRGHTLQIAPYSDRSGVVIICSRCGHFAASKRRNTKLHTDKCHRRFESDGAQFAYKRVCERKHPTYSKGEARILEPAFSASSLVAPALGGAAGPTEDHQT